MSEAKLTKEALVETCIEKIEEIMPSAHAEAIATELARIPTLEEKLKEASENYDAAETEIARLRKLIEEHERVGALAKSILRRENEVQSGEHNIEIESARNEERKKSCEDYYNLVKTIFGHPRLVERFEKSVPVRDRDGYVHTTSCAGSNVISEEKGD